MSTYITPAQAKEKSRVTGISAESDENLEKLITEAEPLVDSYCGFWEKADEDQARLFPRVDEETIPQEVTDATLAVVEQLFLQDAPTLEGEITEERIGDYSYKKSAASTDPIPERAKILLRGLRKLTGKVHLKTE